MSGGDPPFELKNCTDLFNKAKRDLAELEKLVTSDGVFNCLCTLNHIGDWIEKDSHIDQSVKHDARTLMQSNPAVDVVRQLCNRAKHFTRRVSSPDTAVYTGYNSGRFGVGAYGIGEPTYEIEVGSQMVTVLSLLRAALAEWEGIFTKHGLC